MEPRGTALAAVGAFFALAAGGAAVSPEAYVTPEKTGAGGVAALDPRNCPPATIQAEEGDELTDGTLGDDVIIGTEGDDRLYGGAGEDVICGPGGDGKVFAGTGNDRISGGAGFDAVEGSAGADWIFGLAGADTLKGSDGDDHLLGNDGDDGRRCERAGRRLAAPARANDVDSRQPL